jgi:hypothetical protein
MKVINTIKVKYNNYGIYMNYLLLVTSFVLAVFKGGQ